MLMKLIGGILVIAACGLFGIALSNKFSGRPKDIKTLRISLQMLETEILYGATPLPYAFKNIADKSSRIWIDFFKSMRVNLMSGSYYTVNEAWCNAVENELKDSCLTIQDKELIKSFGNILGSSDREDQQKHFKLFYKQLEQQEIQAEEDRKKNEKMYRSLGFLIGIVVLILFI